METGPNAWESRGETLPAIGEETDDACFDTPNRLNEENTVQLTAQLSKSRPTDAKNTKSSSSFRKKVLKVLPGRKQRLEEIDDERSLSSASYRVPQPIESAIATQNPVSPTANSVGDLQQSALATAARALEPTERSTTQIATINGMRIFNQEVDQSVEERFREVCESLEPALLDHLRKRRVEFRPLSLQILVLGHDESDAAPWIVILCPKKAKARIERFLNKDFAKGICHGPQHCKIRFETAVIDRPLRPTACEPVELVYVEQRELGPSEIWAPRIKVLHSASAHYATMGGFVCVTEPNGRRTIYGLTAGHVLPSIGLCVDDSCSSSSEGDDDDEDVPFPTETGEDNISDDGTAIVLSEQSNNTLENQTWTSLGKMSRMSYSSSARDRDWALIELDQVHKGHLETPEAPLFHGQDVYQPQTKRSAIVGSGALLSCSISRVSSRAILPSGQNFVNMHLLRLFGANAPPAGSSGSWVVNADSNKAVQIRGSLVATDPFGILWMVPIKDIISDIRKESKASDINISIRSKSLLEPPSDSNVGQEAEQSPPHFPDFGSVRTASTDELQFYGFVPGRNMDTPPDSCDGRKSRIPVIHNGGGQSHDSNTSTSAPNSGYYN